MTWDRKVPFIKRTDGTGARWERRAGDMMRDGYMNQGEAGDTEGVFDWRDADEVFYATFVMVDYHRGRSAVYFELERLNVGTPKPRYYINLEHVVELFERTGGYAASGYWKLGKKGSAFSLVPVDKP